MSVLFAGLLPDPLPGHVLTTLGSAGVEFQLTNDIDKLTQYLKEIASKNGIGASSCIQNVTPPNPQNTTLQMAPPIHQSPGMQSAANYPFPVTQAPPAGYRHPMMYYPWPNPHVQMMPGCPPPNFNVHHPPPPNSAPVTVGALDGFAPPGQHFPASNSNANTHQPFGNHSTEAVRVEHNDMTPASTISSGPDSSNDAVLNIKQEVATHGERTEAISNDVRAPPSDPQSASRSGASGCNEEIHNNIPQMKPLNQNVVTTLHLMNDINDIIRVKTEVEVIEIDDHEVTDAPSNDTTVSQDVIASVDGLNENELIRNEGYVVIENNVERSDALENIQQEREEQVYEEGREIHVKVPVNVVIGQENDVSNSVETDVKGALLARNQGQTDLEHIGEQGEDVPVDVANVHNEQYDIPYSNQDDANRNRAESNDAPENVQQEREITDAEVKNVPNETPIDDVIRPKRMKSLGARKSGRLSQSTIKTTKAATGDDSDFEVKEDSEDDEYLPAGCQRRKSKQLPIRKTEHSSTPMVNRRKRMLDVSISDKEENQDSGDDEYQPGYSQRKKMKGLDERKSPRILKPTTRTIEKGTNRDGSMKNLSYLTCDLCEKTFTRGYDVLRHKATVHRQNKHPGSRKSKQ